MDRTDRQVPHSLKRPIDASSDGYSESTVSQGYSQAVLSHLTSPRPWKHLSEALEKRGVLPPSEGSGFRPVLRYCASAEDFARFLPAVQRDLKEAENILLKVIEDLETHRRVLESAQASSGSRTLSYFCEDLGYDSSVALRFLREALKVEKDPERLTELHENVGLFLEKSQQSVEYVSSVAVRLVDSNNERAR